MEKEILEAKPPIYKNDRSIYPSIHTFDLPKLIDEMKHDHTWLEGELNAMVLLKNTSKQIMLTALHKETVINSFQCNDSITFQIIEGKLKFHTRKETVTLEKGQLLTLHENIKYSLSTNEETVFLLTISNNTFQPAEN
jgi:quercetin dioxygenase-like cupin family protein